MSRLPRQDRRGVHAALFGAGAHRLAQPLTALEQAAEPRFVERQQRRGHDDTGLEPARRSVIGRSLDSNRFAIADRPPMPALQETPDRVPNPERVSATEPLMLPVDDAR